MSAVTPLQALRRLVDVARLIDADECPELYNQLQAELAVAGSVLAEPAKHSDDFAHFLSYSSLSAEPADVLEKMRRAFEARQSVEVEQDARDEVIEAILGAAEQWSLYVEEDRAPMTLIKCLEMARDAAMALEKK